MVCPGATYSVHQLDSTNTRANRMSNSRTSRRNENLACKLSRNHYLLGGRGLLLAAAARALLASLALGAALALRTALALASLAGGSATAAFGGHDC